MYEINLICYGENIIISSDYSILIVMNILMKLSYIKCKNLYEKCINRDRNWAVLLKLIIVY